MEEGADMEGAVQLKCTIGANMYDTQQVHHLSKGRPGHHGTKRIHYIEAYLDIICAALN